MIEQLVPYIAVVYFAALGAFVIWFYTAWRRTKK